MQPQLSTHSLDAPLTPLTYARRAEPSELPELMDGPLPYNVLRDYLRDLAKVNRFTRGYLPTLVFLNRITDLIAKDHSVFDPLRILDVGSGGGDTLRVIAQWATRHGLAVELTGIDLNPHVTRAALELSSKDPLAASINFLTADVFTYTPRHQPDIILSALFTHHLTTPEILRFLRWTEDNARLGWFINDLHRSRRAATLFRFVPLLFGWHSHIQHDGPVSLRRAFVPADWQRMLATTNIPSATIEQHPMNRLCVARVREPR